MTEYRTVTIITHMGDRYLQFKSKKREICWPKFWEKREVECWRLVPKVDAYVHSYIREEDCPEQIPYGMEARYRHCLYSQESSPLVGLTDFNSSYPNIQDYLDVINEKRDEYLKERKRAKNAAATYLE